MKKILYAASEARPYGGAGGLADVAGSYPRALKSKGVDCRIVMPLYKMPDELRKSMTFVTSFDVWLSWRKQHCEIFEAESGGVTYYFINNMHYFKRNELYGEPDEAERFAFFSLAVLVMLPLIDFKPDIIHANDWHTALIPVYRHVFYADNEFYSDIKTVLTIHNISFQGNCDLGILSSVFGLPYGAKNLVEHEGRINLLKGGIETANAFTTVSPYYAKEIAGDSETREYDFGRGLTWFIKDREYKLKGILNGLDKDKDPKTDKDIFKNYGVKDFQAGKRENKLKLYERLLEEEQNRNYTLALDKTPDVPLIAIVTRIDSQQKGCQIILDAVHDIDGGLLDGEDAQFIILGTAPNGDGKGKSMEDAFKEAAYTYKGKMSAVIAYSQELAQKIYAASDIFLVPSLYEPCGLTQMIALKYGSVPVVRETGGLKDTVKDNQNGDGNGFTFKEYSGYALKSAVRRAMDSYKNTDEWNKLIKRAMACDFDWAKSSADEYIKLYESL